MFASFRSPHRAVPLSALSGMRWFIASALAIAALAALGLTSLARGVEHDRESAAALQRIATQVQAERAIGWHAIADRAVGNDTGLELANVRDRLADDLTLIDRLRPDVARTTRARLDTFQIAADKDLATLGYGEADRARTIQDKSVEPRFMELRSALDASTRQLDRRATARAQTALLGSIGLLLAALGMILLSTLRWQRSWYALRAGSREQESLRASEERFRTLIDDASDMVTVVHADGTITSQSRACRRILGCEPEEITEHGLADLVHPDDAPLALALLRQTADEAPRVVEWRMRHRNGYWVDVETAVNDMLDDARVGAMILTTRDVTERKALEHQLRHRAFHDPLTQLPNRALFLDRTEHALNREGRFSDRSAVLFLDLDDFKLVNDRLGHALGDEVLVLVAQRLRGCLRSADTAARLGGDEFGVLLESVEGVGEPREIARRILQALEAPLEVGGRSLTVSPSIGVVLGRCGHDGAPELLRRADVAMYAAKQQGKGRFEIYDEDVHGSLDPTEASPTEPDRISFFMRTEDQRAEIAALLRDPDALRIVFQPIVDLRSGMVAGYEALSRISVEPQRPPSAWFAQAHRCGLGVQLELEAVVRALAAPGRPGDTYLSVNLSPSTLASAQLFEALPDDLHAIVIELTENELVAGGEPLTRALTALRQRGARIAVDDAGAGYAGLRQLTALAPDIIKLDRSIVDGVATDPAKLALIESFVRFSAQIGAAVCAEGIERLDDLRILADVDVTHGQGYVLGRPSEPWIAVLEPAAMRLREALREALELPQAGSGRALQGDARLESISAELAIARDARSSGAVLESMAQMLHADELILSVMAPDGEHVRAVATNGGPTDQAHYRLSDYPATRRVLHGRCAMQVFTTDPSADRAERTLLESEGYEGLLMLPVTAAGVSVGLLEARTRVRRPWSRRETALARLFAFQLAALVLSGPAEGELVQQVAA